ncbi:Glyoxylate/hydroxypyruvate reductase HPR3-like protein, partial [Drosera capensis]
MEEFQQPPHHPSPHAPPPLPRVLLLSAPSVYLTHRAHFAAHFHFLESHLSPHLPLPQFLSAHSAADVSVLLASGNGPPITADGVLRDLPELKCIVTTSAGVNHIDLGECRRRGIVVANAGDVFGEDVADAAVGLLLDVMRMVSAGDRFVRGGEWKGEEAFGLGRKLTGKRVGIVGLGNIGSKVATRLAAFNCSIFYSSRKRKPDVPYV